jgi:hypothetical protein
MNFDLDGEGEDEDEDDQDQIVDPLFPTHHAEQSSD